MTRSEQKIQKALKMLTEEYQRSKEIVWIRKPMAHALYIVWRYFDEYEKPRIAESEDKE